MGAARAHGIASGRAVWGSFGSSAYGVGRASPGVLGLLPTDCTPGRGAFRTRSKEDRKDLWTKRK